MIQRSLAPPGYPGLHILDQTGAHVAECHNSFRVEFASCRFYLLPILYNPIH
jgi:hypothetical protein